MNIQPSDAASKSSTCQCDQSWWDSEQVGQLLFWLSCALFAIAVFLPIFYVFQIRKDYKPMHEEVSTWNQSLTGVLQGTLSEAQIPDKIFSDERDNKNAHEVLQALILELRARKEAKTNPEQN